MLSETTLAKDWEQPEEDNDGSTCRNDMNGFYFQCIMLNA